MSPILACVMLLAVDGDTIKCDGINMRNMVPGQPFKSGYDTPELGKAECAEERAAGRKAKDRMQQLLDQPGMQVIDSGKRDSYGRPLVWGRLASSETAGEAVLREAYAVPVVAELPVALVRDGQGVEHDGRDFPSCPGRTQDGSLQPLLRASLLLGVGQPRLHSLQEPPDACYERKDDSEALIGRPKASLA